MKLWAAVVRVILALWVFAPAMMTGQALASDGDAAVDADCALYSQENMTGASWTARVAGKDPYAPKLTDWWQGRVTSIYVRQGYVLELYAAPYFTGRFMALQPGLMQGVTVAGGLSINLQDLGFSKEVASYRCRVATTRIETPVGDAPWVEGASYYWYSGGNHYDEKWLKMQTINGHAIVTAHSDDTYSINVQDYEIDLTEGLVKIRFKAYGGVTGVTEFAFKMAAARSDFHGMLDELVATMKVIAQGFYRPHADKAAPPAPELIELAAFFATL
ncbi:MAG: hypothetical protein FJ146_11575 [Deltaproteobacteria bacterium]|nr:hypothetical protein [Deltaproteobacteria bacterium]